MTAPQLFGTTFLGAILSDILALSAAMRTGRLRSRRWRQPMTYLGICLKGVIASVVAFVLFGQMSNSVTAFSLGLNLPLLLEKIAQLTPKLLQDELARNPGFAGQRGASDSTATESVRRFFANEER